MNLRRPIVFSLTILLVICALSLVSTKTKSTPSIQVSEKLSVPLNLIVPEAECSDCSTVERGCIEEASSAKQFCEDIASPVFCEDVYHDTLMDCMHDHGCTYCYGGMGTLVPCNM